MSYKAWYNQDADYNTNARSYMDYLARHNKFMKVLVDDYEVFKEIMVEEFKQFQLDTDETIESFQSRLDTIQQEMTDLFIDWLEDGTLETIINENIFTSIKEEIKKVDSKIDVSSFDNAIDLVHSWQTNKTQTTTPVYIEVGDSLRASNGSHTYEQIHDYLMSYGVITHLVAASGLKAEHFSKTTPNLQQGFHTLDSVIDLISNDGFNVVVNISLGMNDINKTENEIESYLDKIVNDIITVKPLTKFIFTSPQKTENAYTYDKLNKVYRNIVNKYAVSFIDVGSNVFKHFTPSIKSLYFIDSTHPNEQGQLKIAQYILSKLKANNARKPYSTITPSIPQDHYVRVARIVLKQQWMGVTGRLKITQLGSAFYQANTTYIDIFSYLRNSLPSIDTTNVIYDFSNVNAEEPDILTNNIFIRPTVMTDKMTIVDVFIKNRVTSDRRFKVEFDGSLTGGIGTSQIIINSSASIELLPYIVSGGSDADITVKNNFVLSSPDGKKWQIKVDDSGEIVTTNIAW